MKIGIKVGIAFMSNIIVQSNAAIAKERDNIRKAIEEIDRLQSKCTHDFEEVPCMGANIVKCKICGYEDRR